ncbi:hypothetical protein QLQ15_13430 [Lysobacter sp. LF1]|uniref:Uncharacterized protein n=1 Tax=Lysobacter stagni TaxID=3045172 RepID=A0ABT6XID6_9GAMM|nr:hypothetical protein [Lysobacter sp. LF1]MDI9239908.1 hypothetical protein [Lysobacter sp. LF1]
MNLADAVNPFFLQLDTPPVKDPATQLITTAGNTVIYSAVDEVTIASTLALAQYATVVADENDLVVYGLDVILAGDLLHRDRGPSASRNIRIRCRTLTVLETADKVTTIDVSGYVDDRCETHILPDVSVALSSASQKAGGGDDIAYALNHRSDANPWSNWFATDPGAGWAEQGARGGIIDIACETLVLHQKLNLMANGARGNAGVGGQNVKNWIPGLVGGDAGRGGSGGDGGTVRLVCNAVVDKDGNSLNLLDWVGAQSDAGPDGDPGLPGAAYDPSQQNNHYGSYAEPVQPGQSNDTILLEPDDLVAADGSGTQAVGDVSAVAVGCDAHYWALLYHRVKLEYLKNQPMTMTMPSAIDPTWVALGVLIKWSNRYCYAFGDVGDDLRAQCIADVADDPERSAKDSIARALKLMDAWYLSGKTMWGMSVTSVSPMPLDTIFSYVDQDFVHQKDVRDYYIKLRSQLSDAIKSNADLENLRNAAQYAVDMHKNAVDGLKKILFGSTDNSGVDAASMLGALNAADSDCNTAIARLGQDLAGLDDKVNSAIGIGVDDVLSSIKSMLFVAGDPPALFAMGAAEGFSLYEKAKNDVTDDTGNSMAKDAVITQLHQMTGSVDDLAKMVNGMVPNQEVGRLDQAILTSLDNIDAYVSRFTKVLGDAGTDVLDEVAALRQKVNYKNDIWMDYNDKVYQLAKEWEDYQAALAKKQTLDESTQQELSGNLVDAVQIYTGMYLANLERTADLRAQMLRKFAYVTLDDDLPDDDFVGNISAFWSAADATSAQAMADQADGNWDIEKSAVVGSDDSSSVRYRLAQYNAGSQSIVIQAPDATAVDKKSTFYISVRGNSAPQDAGVLTTLLAHRAVWLQVVQPATFTGRYIDAAGVASTTAPKIPTGVAAYPLIAGRDWDIRITHVNPWIEGIQTDSGTVQFHIKLGTSAYIVDAKVPPNARYYGYEQKAISTQFAHYTDISLSDQTNNGMAGDAAGEVSDEYVDKRGIYVPFQLSIPDGGLNTGLRAVKDVSQVNLDVHFRVIFRASLGAALLSRR